jgi:hypothetical protein
MPTELLLYFQYVNGMSMRGGHDVGDNGFSFPQRVQLPTS